MSTQDELDDLPEMTEEHMRELRTPEPEIQIDVISKEKDLHLGAPKVKKIDTDWFIKEYGPKPPGPGILTLDVLVVVLFLGMCDILLLSWIHVFS